MSSLAIACIMFGGVLTSTLVAMAIARRLPAEHLAGDSKDVVKQGLGVIGTLTALVLGLLVSATKGTYDTQSGMVKELAADLALIDRTLERYGAETKDARARVHDLTQAVLEQFWPHDGSAVDFRGGRSKGAGEAAFEALDALQPQTDAQRLLKARAEDSLVDLAKVRQRLAANSERSIPPVLLILLGCWQAVLFAGFGLLAPRNPTAFTVLVICMLSVSGALYLVMELDRPFDGIVRVSDAPLRALLK